MLWADTLEFCVELEHGQVGSREFYVQGGSKVFKKFILKFAKQANELSEEIWRMTENESITGAEALKLSAIIELSPRTICWNPEEYEVESLNPGELVLKYKGEMK